MTRSLWWRGVWRDAGEARASPTKNQKHIVISIRQLAERNLYICYMFNDKKLRNAFLVAVFVNML